MTKALVSTERRESKGTTTIDQLLPKNLPDNFDNLSKREQKEIIISHIMKLFKQMTDCMAFEQKGVEAARILAAQLKANPTAMKLVAIRKDLKRNSEIIRALTERAYGVKEIAVALGISEKTLEKIKLIEE
jgi:DNA-binding NarL/FixJ family response regulator